MKLSQLSEDICQLSKEFEEINISGLTADSREVRSGYLFAALSGVQVDGAQFIPSALEKGAAAILCDADADIKIENDIPLLKHDNPRLALALMARRFYPEQPDKLVAVTGTNGKSSIASFVRQIWTHLGLNAASLGTIGIETSEGIEPLAHTTPDPVSVSKLLQDLALGGVEHVAFEASSHGLSQYRLHGMNLIAGAFSNITHDHLDYHKTFDDYFDAKMRLFEEVMRPGSVAVISADHEYSGEVIRRASENELAVMSVGYAGEHIKLITCEPQDLMQNLRLEYEDKLYDVCLPLAGKFQVENAIIAAGLVIACGASPEQVFPMLSRLHGAKGRLEKTAVSLTGAPIFIDYAHTPDALENALLALKPVVKENLVLVFGCGGDRDKAKRPLMGQVAAKYADRIIVTDDNPRSESPEDIRLQILAMCPDAVDIGDRKKAIGHGLGLLQEGDVLLIAGKGHETGQIIGNTTLPFSDHDMVHDLLNSV